MSAALTKEMLKDAMRIQTENGALGFAYSNNSLVDVNFKIPELRRTAANLNKAARRQLGILSDSQRRRELAEQAKNCKLQYRESLRAELFASGQPCTDSDLLRAEADEHQQQDYKPADYNFFEKYLGEAYAETPEYTLRWLFYLRDARGGLGERESFRTLLKDFLQLYFLDANAAAKIRHETLSVAQAYALLKLVPEYGRWDDLLWLLVYSQNAMARKLIILIVLRQLRTDCSCLIHQGGVSLLAKWLPSASTKSPEGRAVLHVLVKKYFGDFKTYRKLLTRLRERLDVVERKQCAGEWDKIKYEAVPSRTNLLYGAAFERHDAARRQKFLERLTHCETKINASALFLYDIVHKYRQAGLSAEDETLEALWNAQPAPASELNDVLVVRDGSGSMTSTIGGASVTALDVADAITLYAVEHNQTPGFSNTFITFSSHPQMVDLAGQTTLAAKLRELQSYDDYSNTDIQSVFELVLRAALKNDLPQQKMPVVLIISDMEFDEARGEYGFSPEESSASLDTLFEILAAEYARYGYKLPKLVFWNVDSRTGAIPLRENKHGVILVSGFSRQIVDMVLSQRLDPWLTLKDFLDKERYALVTETLTNASPDDM